MKSKKEDPEIIELLVNKFGLIGTSILMVATLYRVLAVLVGDIRHTLIFDFVIILLMILFYLWRRLVK